MLKYDKIVIGATHSSVLYSLLTNTPLIFAKGVETHPFDFHEAGTDLGAFGIESHDYELRTSDGKRKIIGAPKHHLSDRILPALSLSGLTPFCSICKAIRIEGDTLKIITTGNKSFEVKYGELIVFDDSEVHGLPVSDESDEDVVKVLDWFNVRQGARHEIDYIATGDKFIEEIFFHTPVRDYTKAIDKDLVAISNMPRKDARYAYECSETYAKFKVEKIMKSSGIKGFKNGKNPNWSPEKPHLPRFKYVSPKVEHVLREIIPNPMAKYEDYDKISFSYDTPSAIIDKHMTTMDTYALKLLSEFSRWMQ